MKPLATEQLVFRRTASRLGRHVSVTPENSPLSHLSYGRVRLSREQPRVAFETEGRETALLCMRGACRVIVNGEALELDTYDGLYVPRGASLEISTATEVDLVECSADVERDYPLQVVRYAHVREDPSLRFTTGGPSTSRELTILMGNNVNAGRLLAGFTRSKPGNWTSWPPHEHAAMLEEMYVYFDMPAPAFGIQLVYTEPENPELVEIVRDGDAVLMPSGYHPNVAAPGQGINFIWLMAAHREGIDRRFGVVNVQPGFDGNGSGLDAARSGARFAR